MLDHLSFQQKKIEMHKIFLSIVMLIKIVFFLLSSLIYPSTEAVSILPGNSTVAVNETIGLVFVGSEFLKESQYFRVLSAVQRGFNGTLWIAVCGYPEVEVSMEQALLDAVRLMQAGGMKMSSERTPFFFVGHSSGILFRKLVKYKRTI